MVTCTTSKHRPAPLPSSLPFLTPFTPSSRAPHASELPFMDDASSRKRPRPVVSCLRCRDKKLKCDRTAPCENCVKASTANSCTYNRNGISPGKNDFSTPVVNHAPMGSLEDLQYRMAKVEELLGVARAHQNSVRVVEKPAPATPLPLLGTVVVKGNRSHYHGQNDRITLLNQVSIIPPKRLFGRSLRQA